MDALKLYKFICENRIEINWGDDDHLILWVPFYHLQDFTDMIGDNYLSDGGHDVNLQRHCVALDIIPICEYFDVEPTDILKKEE